MPESPSRPTATHRRRGWITAALVIPAAMLSAVLVANLAAPTPPTARPASPQRPASPPHSPTATRSPAAPCRLAALADRVAAAPTDTRNHLFVYHRYRRWLLHSTGTPAPRPNTPAVFAIETRRWEASDHSVLQRDITPPPDYTLAGAHPGYRSTDAEFAGTAPHVQHLTPDQTQTDILDPLATDPALLSAQLHYDPLAGIDEMFTYFDVAPPVRAAALRLLAATPGLTCAPHVADRLGRLGTAITRPARDTLATLVFDDTTGQLLASQEQFTGRDPELAVPPRLIGYYTLFIEQGRRDFIPA